MYLNVVRSTMPDVDIEQSKGVDMYVLVDALKSTERISHLFIVCILCAPH